MNFKKILKNFVIFAISGLAFSSFLVLNHTMENGHNGQTSSCLLMATNSTSCQMSVGEHILVWQETFIASISSNFIFVISLLSILLLISYIKCMGTDPPLRFLKKYEKENHRLNIFNYLLWALSRGIIHPEIYA